MEPRLTRSKRQFRPLFAMMVVVTYALLVSGFFVVRYQGSWVEQDTTQLTAVSKNVYDAGALQPEGKVYPYGFGYSASLTFLSNLCGLPVESFQTLIGPFALIVTALCSLALFSNLTGDLRLGTLSALILCMQAELVFVVMRGSHEKFTWALIMVTLLLLVKSFSFVGRWSAFLACMTLTYVTVFAVISLNSFFASSFTAAIATSFLVGWVVVIGRLQEQRLVPNLRRLLYMVGSCGVLIYLFIFQLYTPAAQIFDLLDTGLDRLASLLLNIDTAQTASPYGYVATGWVSRRAYWALTGGSWFILLASFLAWGRAAYRMFFRRQRPPLHHLLLWLFYSAFAGQIGLSLLTDALGLLGTNLQVRLFPAVMIFAVPLLVVELKRLWTERWGPHPRLRLALGITGVVCLFWLSAASTLKATVEPVLSNKWLYYTGEEDSALTWAEGKMRYAHIWAGYDERLRQVAYFHHGLELPSGNHYDIFSLDSRTRHILLSDLVRQQAVRIRQPLPDVRGAHQVYDNGSVELHQYRPQTPYQR